MQQGIKRCRFNYLTIFGGSKTSISILQRNLTGKYRGQTETIVFKRWSNKKWAVFASFHKVIIIAVLSYCNQILSQQTLEVQADTSNTQWMIILEEVEAAEDLHADIDNVTLRPILQLSSREISQSVANSTEDLLENLPQIDIRQRGKHGIQADLSIQGGTFDQSLVLLDGINISDPQTGHFQLNLPLDLPSINRMEVITGSASRRFGTQAFSGAVNLVTTPLDSTFYQAGFTYGQHRFMKGVAKANLKGKHISTLLSAGSARSDGYRENTDFRNTNVFLHSVAETKKLETHLILGLNKRAFGANAFYSPRFIQQYEETSTSIAAMKLHWKKARSSYTLNAYYRQNRDHFLLDRKDPSYYVNDHLTRVSGADLLGLFSTIAGITSTGINTRFENIISTSLGEPLAEEEKVHYNDSIVFTSGHVRTQVNMNLNHTYQWNNSLSISGGFMAHMNSDLDYQPRIFPGIDLRISLPDSYWIYASVNKSMRLPTFTDLYYQGPTNVGNPDLDPETATQYETGIYHDSRYFHAGINAFYRQGRDLIDWIWMEDETWHTMNLTEVNALGGDLRLLYTPVLLLNRRFQFESVRFSYSFTHLTKVSEDVISRYLLDNQRHKLVLSAGARIFDNIYLNITSSGQDRNGTYLLYDSETGMSKEQEYDPFILLDAKLAFEVGPIRIFFEASNILDVTYNDIGNVIQPGRWILAGFELSSN